MVGFGDEMLVGCFVVLLMFGLLGLVILVLLRKGSVRVSFLVRWCVETHTLSVTNTVIGAFVQKQMYLLLKHTPYLLPTK